MSHCEHDGIAKDIPGPIAHALARHARRDIGRTGMREVTLDLFCGDEQTCRYTLWHAWMVENGRCTSLYVLDQPAIVAGTAVKLVERPLIDHADIWLSLSTARDPLPIGPSERHQFILGSDFTYDDLRFWLASDGLDRFVVEAGGPPETCTFTARRRTQPATRLRMTVDLRSGVPLTIDWLDPERRWLVRRYSATGITSVDDIWLPTAITVSRKDDRYRSVMTLQRVLHGIDLQPDAFRTENLPRALASIRQWRDSTITIAAAASE